MGFFHGENGLNIHYFDNFKTAETVCSMNFEFRSPGKADQEIKPCNCCFLGEFYGNLLCNSNMKTE